MADRNKVLSMLAKDARIEADYIAELTPPSTWSPPDDAKAGREFEFMASGIIKDDGTLCITKLGGIEKDEDSEMEFEEEAGTEAGGGGYMGM